MAEADTLPSGNEKRCSAHYFTEKLKDSIFWFRELFPDLGFIKDTVTFFSLFARKGMP